MSEGLQVISFLLNQCEQKNGTIKQLQDRVRELEAAATKESRKEAKAAAANVGKL